MIQKFLKPKYRHLVFTSAGDNASVTKWLKGKPYFDLWITYYGSVSGRYSEISKFYNERKGSKFQNLFFLYQNYRELLYHYDSIMVMDDDILINAGQINRLFQIREAFDLWILQPSFTPLGKISWPITIARRENVLRFTDFIEMTCPLFKREKLDIFMLKYDPELISYGCDFMFLDTIGNENGKKVAVIDSVVCKNPHAKKKGGIREIDKLAPARVRVGKWRMIKEKYQIDCSNRFNVIDAVKKRGSARYTGMIISMIEIIVWKIRKKIHYYKVRLIS